MTLGEDQTTGRPTSLVATSTITSTGFTGFVGSYPLTMRLKQADFLYSVQTKQPSTSQPEPCSRLIRSSSVERCPTMGVKLNCFPVPANLGPTVGQPARGAAPCASSLARLNSSADPRDTQSTRSRTTITSFLPKEAQPSITKPRFSEAHPPLDHGRTVLRSERPIPTCQSAALIASREQPPVIQWA